MLTSKAAFLQKAQSTKLVAFDVDGVFTSGNLYLSGAKEEALGFYIHDGLGIKLLHRIGMEVAIISSRAPESVKARMTYLGIKHLYLGQADKRIAFNALLTKLDLTPEQVAYVGDDLPDIPPIRAAGLGIAVANAHPAVVQQADWQTIKSGGQGAVREVCDLFLEAQGKLDTVLAEYL